VLTGRHGIFISYDSFFHIIASQIDQYIKFRKTVDEILWRKSTKGMTYLATSTLWRQEHNGYTHQNPSLINSLLGKQTDRVRMFFPIGTNTLLATIQQSYVNDSYVNYITAGKTNFPQWLTLDEAMTAVREGSMVWDWCSDEDPDLVLVSIGDYQHYETMAAAETLRDIIPNLKVRIVNVQHFTPLGIPGLTNLRETNTKLTEDKPVIVNFHGYPEVIKQLFFGSPVANRMTILGYLEKGGTTTPFDMQVLNKTSRYHVVLFASQKLEQSGRISGELYTEIEKNMEKIIQKHQDHILQTGTDIPEVVNWKPKNYKQN
jgi:xylulose-5-phosphate/fructose-6-phosphate phosphoketolase